MRIYAPRIENLAALARKRLTRTLTREECESYLHRSSCPPVIDALGRYVEGKQLARFGDVAGAIGKFERARRLDASMSFDPKAEAARLAAESLIQSAAWQVRLGLVKDALADYSQARIVDPTFRISAPSWNTLCWNGSLWGYAAEVMNACEEAVKADPSSWNIRDSRALARALTGNVNGAIEDFLPFIHSTADPLLKAQRQRWVDALRAGQNPFTQAELQRLRR